MAGATESTSEHFSRGGASGSPHAATLSETLRVGLERELDEGESLLWVGQPNRRRMFWAGYVPALTLSVMLLVLSSVGAFGVADSLITLREAADAGGVPAGELRSARNTLWIAGGFAIFFSLPMLWTVIFEPARLRHIAQNTVYAITPHRAIVLIVGKRKTTERDYCADELTHLLRKERRDGSGDLIFEAARGGQPRSSSGGAAHGFVAIADVLAVEKLLRARFGGRIAARSTGSAKSSS